MGLCEGNGFQCSKGSWRSNHNRQVLQLPTCLKYSLSVVSMRCMMYKLRASWLSNSSIDISGSVLLVREGATRVEEEEEEEEEGEGDKTPTSCCPLPLLLLSHSSVTISQASSSVAWSAVSAAERNSATSDGRKELEATPAGGARASVTCFDWRFCLRPACAGHDVRWSLIFGDLSGIGGISRYRPCGIPPGRSNQARGKEV